MHFFKITLISTSILLHLSMLQTFFLRDYVKVRNPIKNMVPFSKFSKIWELTEIHSLIQLCQFFCRAQILPLTTITKNLGFWSNLRRKKHHIHDRMFSFTVTNVPKYFFFILEVYFRLFYFCSRNNMNSISALTFKNTGWSKL